MKTFLMLGLLIGVSACCDPTAPDFAVLDSQGEWRVQLSDGTRCVVAHAFWIMEREEQAIAECRTNGPLVRSRT